MHLLLLDKEKEILINLIHKELVRAIPAGRFNSFPDEDNSLIPDYDKVLAHFYAKLTAKKELTT